MSKLWWLLGVIGAGLLVSKSSASATPSSSIPLSLNQPLPAVPNTGALQSTQAAPLPLSQLPSSVTGSLSPGLAPSANDPSTQPAAPSTPAPSAVILSDSSVSGCITVSVLYCNEIVLVGSDGGVLSDMNVNLSGTAQQLPVIYPQGEIVQYVIVYGPGGQTPYENPFENQQYQQIATDYVPVNNTLVNDSSVGVIVSPLQIVSD